MVHVPPYNEVKQLKDVKRSIRKFCRVSHSLANDKAGARGQYMRTFLGQVSARGKFKAVDNFVLSASISCNTSNIAAVSLVQVSGRTVISRVK